MNEKERNFLRQENASKFIKQDLTEYEITDDDKNIRILGLVS